jgi:hypothetical protein
MMLSLRLLTPLRLKSIDPDNKTHKPILQGFPVMVVMRPSRAGYVEVALSRASAEADSLACNVEKLIDFDLPASITSEGVQDITRQKVFGFNRLVHPGSPELLREFRTNDMHAENVVFDQQGRGNLNLLILTLDIRRAFDDRKLRRESVISVATTARQTLCIDCRRVCTMVWHVEPPSRAL